MIVAKKNLVTINFHQISISVQIAGYKKTDDEKTNFGLVSIFSVSTTVKN